MRRYEERIVQDCGACYFDPMTQDFVVVDQCDRHREDRRCTVCGDKASKSTIAHGSLSPATWHRPEFEEED